MVEAIQFFPVDKNNYYHALFNKQCRAPKQLGISLPSLVTGFFFVNKNKQN